MRGSLLLFIQQTPVRARAAPKNYLVRCVGLRVRCLLGRAVGPSSHARLNEVTLAELACAVSVSAG